MQATTLNDNVCRVAILQTNIAILDQLRVVAIPETIQNFEQLIPKFGLHFLKGLSYCICNFTVISTGSMC